MPARRHLGRACDWDRNAFRGNDLRQARRGEAESTCIDTRRGFCYLFCFTRFASWAYSARLAPTASLLEKAAMPLGQGLAGTFRSFFSRQRPASATMTSPVPAVEATEPELLFAGLNDVQRVLLKWHPPPHLFVVVSWGCAASNWIAHVMNSHPDIFCIHEGNDELKVFGPLPGLDGLEYMRILMMLGRGYKASGDIRGVARHHIPQLRRVFGDKFSAAVVVREPMRRLHSQVALFHQLREIRHDVWKIDYVDALIEQHNLRLPGPEFDHKLFIHGVNMLNAILDERAVGNIYRTEDLTRDPVVLRRFVSEMTRDQVEITDAWLSRELHRKRINGHGGIERREPWSAWQIDVIRKVVQPQTWVLYEQLGYERPAFVS